jgi:hypothetical protein
MHLAKQLLVFLCLCAVKDFLNWQVARLADHPLQAVGKMLVGIGRFIGHRFTAQVFSV